LPGLIDIVEHHLLAESLISTSIQTTVSWYRVRRFTSSPWMRRQDGHWVVTPPAAEKPAKIQCRCGIRGSACSTGWLSEEGDDAARAALRETLRGEPHHLTPVLFAKAVTFTTSSMLEADRRTIPHCDRIIIRHLARASGPGSKTLEVSDRNAENKMLTTAWPADALADDPEYKADLRRRICAHAMALIIKARCRAWLIGRSSTPG